MYQKLTIIGSMEYDPAFGYTNTGMPVCWFNVATEHMQRQNTSFRVLIWESLAEWCHMRLAKDNLVLCEGYLALKTNGEPYLSQDKDNNGELHYSLTALKVIQLEAQVAHDYDVEVLEALEESNIMSRALFDLRGYQD